MLATRVPIAKTVGLMTSCMRARLFKLNTAWRTSGKKASRQLCFVKRHYSAGAVAQDSSSSTEPHRDEQDVLHALQRASDILPHQGILQSFVHRNPLLHFEHLPFDAAVEQVHELERYLSPGQRVLHLTGVNPSKRVGEAVVDLVSVFLDHSGAKWTPSFRHHGFLRFFARLEGCGMAPWRSHARAVALRLSSALPNSASDSDVRLAAASILRETLEWCGTTAGSPNAAHTLQAIMLELRGWAALVHAMEMDASQAPKGVPVNLVEFCAVQCILLRSSCESAAAYCGWDAHREPFAVWLSAAPHVSPHTSHGSKQVRGCNPIDLNFLNLHTYMHACMHRHGAWLLTFLNSLFGWFWRYSTSAQLPSWTRQTLDENTLSCNIKNVS